MRKIFAMCLCALVAGTPGAAQQLSSDPKGFRVDVDAVEVDVRVLDEKGQPVRGLTAQDFELFEDGVRQAVRAFTPVQIPTIPRRAARVEADTQTNRVAFDGRVYAVVLDDLHTHPLRTNRVKAMVRQFLDVNFAGNDRAAIVTTSGRRDTVQDLTGSRRALVSALDAFHGQGLRSATLERIDAYYRLKGADALEDRQRINDPLEQERAYHARQTLTSLRDVARWLDRVPARRKAIIFVSEGIDYDIRDLVGNRFASGVLADVQDAIAGAARSNTSIYAIDPRGLTGIEDETIEVEGLPDDVSRASEVGSAAFLDALRMTQDSLRTLAEETGGFAIVNTNDLGGGLERVARENSEYYLLAYEPTNSRRDGRFRRIEVRVTRPGLHTVARPGYYARKANERAPESTKPVAPGLREVIDSPLPVSGLPLDTSVAVFRGQRDKASALVTIEIGPDLTLVERDGLHRGRVDLSIVAIDASGKIAASERRGVDLNLRPTTRDAMQRQGVRTSARVELKPGRYQIRIAAKDANGPRAGSVLHDVVVPAFESAAVGVSDLVVASASGARAPTTNVDNALKGLLTLPPTAMRKFDPSDEITVLAEVYDNRKEPRTPMTVTTTLTDESARVAFRSEDQIEASAFDSARRVYRHSVSTPLRDLPPGDYVLRVVAQPRDGSRPAAAREVPLSVRRHDS